MLIENQLTPTTRPDNITDRLINMETKNKDRSRCRYKNPSTSSRSAMKLPTRWSPIGLPVRFAADSSLNSVKSYNAVSATRSAKHAVKAVVDRFRDWMPTMEIREFAERVLYSGQLDQKLTPIGSDVSDDNPGPAVRVEAPTRPADLQFAPRRTAPSMPKPVALADPNKRALAHHIMANHELQALEVMAFVLCAFPDAPSEFRRGIIPIMGDEQRHTRMHIERAAALGLVFGQFPVNCYIWKKALAYECVLDYIAGLPLTFEGRNLDHTLEFEEYFQQAGDERSAAVMRMIHRDEIQHVTFGIEWLRKLKSDDQTDWDAYRTHLHWPLRPAKSMGNTFNRAARRATGMSEEFIENLAEADSEET